eukprot:8594499-Heterocapsa_arctica.AAC.1
MAKVSVMTFLLTVSTPMPAHGCNSILPLPRGAQVIVLRVGRPSMHWAATVVGLFLLELFRIAIRPETTAVWPQEEVTCPPCVCEVETCTNVNLTEFAAACIEAVPWSGGVEKYWGPLAWFAGG